MERRTYGSPSSCDGALLKLPSRALWSSFKSPDLCSATLSATLRFTFLSFPIQEKRRGGETYKDLLQFQKSASSHSIHQEDPLDYRNMLLRANFRLVVVGAVIVELELEIEVELGRILVACLVREMDLLLGKTVEAVGAVDLKWRAMRRQDLVVGVVSDPDY